MPTASSFRAYLSSGKNVEEKKLVRKVDFFILTFCCFMYFFNYLDRSNLKQAYVSGMRKDLGFQGNQLTQITTIFTCGYIVYVTSHVLCP
jgi:ACS family pantothenate transporter-like MFS transporter